MQLKPKQNHLKIELATPPLIIGEEVKSSKPADLYQKKEPKRFSSKLLLAGFLLGGMGVAWAILPRSLSCISKAKQAEAKYLIGALNQAQQFYFTERNTFTDSFSELELELKSQTHHYNYSIYKTSQAVFNYAVARHGTEKSYVGAVFLVKNGETNLLESILCEAQQATTFVPKQPIYQGEKLIYAAGTSPI